VRRHDRWHAGHIDRGKTTLVKALTAVDCDRLKEEKAWGMTIDLGFAYLPTEAGRCTWLHRRTG
jgi:selenocysteine-specific elongation factor